MISQVTESKQQSQSVRPGLGRAFLSRLKGLRLPSSKAQLLFWSVFAVGLLLDLWSKRAIFEWLRTRPYGSFTVIDGFFRLVAVENAGAAFGIASGQRILLTIVSVIALLVIVFIFLFAGSGKEVITFALALFTAGLCGNLYDRIFNDGMVRDFIDIYYRDYHWPAFNIADSLLCISVGLLLISGLFIEKSS